MQAVSRRLVVIAAGLFWLVLSAAIVPAFADNPVLVQQAFENMQTRPQVPWSFVQTTTGKDETTVERCEHDLDACAWTLVFVNGSPPTDKELQRYRKDKSKAEKRHGEKSRFETLATPGSIVLLEENDEQAIYRFDPMPEDEDDEEIDRQLEGRLVVSKAGPYVMSFELKNNGTIKPAMFVKIHKMHIAMQFAPVQEGGPYLPLEMQTHVQGKIGGFKSFDEEKHILFSDYRL
jgi:hypothetical protein